MKNINKKIMLIFVAILLFSVGNNEVNAAEFKRGDKYSKIYYDSKGNYVGSGSDFSRTGTVYDKRIGNSLAYCTQFKKGLPANGTTYKTTGSIYDKKNYVAGQIIAIGRNKYGTGKKSYLYISEALNCYFKQSGYFKGACDNSKITYLIDTAKKYVDNYKFSSGSSKYSLPKVTIKTTSTMSNPSGASSGTYVSSKVEISGIQTTNYGSDGTKNTSSKVPTYNFALSLSPSTGKAYLCPSAEYNENDCTESGTITNSTYYIVVVNGGQDGGTVSLKITGSNSSQYPTSKIWSYKGLKNSAYQTMVTKADDVTITRTVSATANFNFPKVNQYSVGIEKVDDTGEALIGASLKLFTAADEKGTQDIKEICSTDASSANTGCSVTDIIADDDNYKYSTDRYICYSETTVPERYVKIDTSCEKINLSGSQTKYYKVSTDGSSETIITEDVYNKSLSYKNGDDLKYRYTINNQPIYSEDATLNYYVDNNGEYNLIDDSSLINNNQIKICPDGESDDANCNYYDVTTVDGTLVCYNDEAGESVADLCSGNYNYNKFTFTQGNYYGYIGNALNYVNISKKDITGTTELFGATLSIYKADESGNCSNELAKSEKFVYKEYSIGNNEDENDTETDSDTSSTDETESDDEDLEDSDTDEGNEAREDIALTGLTWTSSDTSATIYGLNSGNYCLKEEIAPKGYKKTTSIVKFTMNDDGSVTTESSDNYDSENNTLFIKDELTQITISKTDMATSKELPGAELSICESYRDDETGELGMSLDSEGNCTVITLADGTPATWTSTDKPKEIIGISSGTYYLVETVAPNGYETAESIIFTVKEDGTLTDKDGNSLAENKLVMKDKSINDVKTSELPIIIIFIIGIAAIAVGTTYYSKKTPLVNNSNNTSKIRKRKLRNK